MKLHMIFIADTDILLQSKNASKEYDNYILKTYLQVCHSETHLNSIILQEFAINKFPKFYKADRSGWLMMNLIDKYEIFD